MHLRHLALTAVCLTMISACAKKPLPPIDPSSGTRPTFEQVLPRAEAGDPDYQFELGAMYYEGNGVEQDMDEALDWFTKAGEQGNAMAAFNLGLMYQRGEGTKANLTAARRWFTRAADLGDARAAFQLGVMSYEGDGMTKSTANALDYFKRAGAAGSVEGQLNVGLMLLKGDGAPKDDVEATAWLMIAKEGGNARAGELLNEALRQLTAAKKSAAEKRAATLKKEWKGQTSST